MRADFMDKDATGTETKPRPAPASLQRSTIAGGGEPVTAPRRPRVCGFCVDPNSAAPRDLDPWTSKVALAHLILGAPVSSIFHWRFASSPVIKMENIWCCLLQENVTAKFCIYCLVRQLPVAEQVCIMEMLLYFSFCHNSVSKVFQLCLYNLFTGKFTIFLFSSDLSFHLNIWCIITVENGIYSSIARICWIHAY